MTNVLNFYGFQYKPGHLVEKQTLNENLHKAPVFLMSLPDKDHQVFEPLYSSLFGHSALWRINKIEKHSVQDREFFLFLTLFWQLLGNSLTLLCQQFLAILGNSLAIPWQQGNLNQVFHGHVTVEDSKDYVEIILELSGLHSELQACVSNKQS